MVSIVSDLQSDQRKVAWLFQNENSATLHWRSIEVGFERKRTLLVLLPPHCALVSHGPRSAPSDDRPPAATELAFTSLARKLAGEAAKTTHKRPNSKDNWPHPFTRIPYNPLKLVEAPWLTRLNLVLVTRRRHSSSSSSCSASVSLRLRAATSGDTMSTMHCEPYSSPPFFAKMGAISMCQ